MHTDTFYEDRIDKIAPPRPFNTQLNTNNGHFNNNSHFNQISTNNNINNNTNNNNNSEVDFRSEGNFKIIKAKIDQEGCIEFQVKFESGQCVWVDGDKLKNENPHKVIKFYEKRISWAC